MAWASAALVQILWISSHPAESAMLLLYRRSEILMMSLEMIFSLACVELHDTKHIRNFFSRVRVHTCANRARDSRMRIKDSCTYIQELLVNTYRQTQTLKTFLFRYVNTLYYV